MQLRGFHLFRIALNSGAYPSCSEDSSFPTAAPCPTPSAAWAQPWCVIAGPARCWVPFHSPLSRRLLPSSCSPRGRTPVPSAPLSHGTSASWRGELGRLSAPSQDPRYPLWYEGSSRCCCVVLPATYPLPGIFSSYELFIYCSAFEAELLSRRHNLREAVVPPAPVFQHML